MAHESQDAYDKMWPPHIEHIFIKIMVEEQIKGNMENGVFKGLMWETMTQELNKRTGKKFITKKVFQKHNRLWGKKRKWSQLLNRTGLGWDEASQTVTCTDKVWVHVVAANRNANNLRKKGCPNYDKLRQLFAQYYKWVPSDFIKHTSIEQQEIDVVYQTQATGKCPMQEASAKGKKVMKKVHKVSEMTVAMKEYIAMMRERFSGNRGKLSGTSKQFAQSATRGDPCSLGKAIDMLNQCENLGNKANLKISKALHVMENRVFMGMLEHRRRAWMENIVNPED
ncbi:uncharacterized protein LOC142606022 [Castanea sativa]|uniref:uncharacterized protein LOC142606022 n=1 Tax=Castanea sativa TaxID=21020 RepID=UPI003F64D502